MGGSRYAGVCAAADVCDKHPADKQVMVWECFDGAIRLRRR